MTIERYNFRKPGRLAGDLDQRLMAWLRGACALAAQAWGKVLPFVVAASARAVDLVATEEGLALLPEAVVAYRVGLRGQTLTTVLAAPRQAALALVGGLLGDGGTELPADRELTPVEESLWEYFLRELFLPALERTWPGTEALGIELQGREPHPRWTRAFGTEEKVVVGSLTWQGPFGDHEGHWLLPEKGLLALLGERRRGPRQPTPEPAVLAARVEELVRNLPIEVTVVLGEVRLQLPELAGLRAGDVVILDQRTTEPLTALVGREKKFHGWPGRLGTWQAFQIESLTDG